MTVIPTIPLNVVVNQLERAFHKGNITIRFHWKQPENFDQFDIDHYDISVTSTSGVQHTTTARGQCTSTVITVSENNLRMNTTFVVTITAVNLCGEHGPNATASYTLSESSLLLYHVVMLYVHGFKLENL